MTDKPKVRQTYRFEIDPTEAQRRRFAQHAGTSRYAWNWGLHMIEEALRERREGYDCKVPTWVDLGNRWNACKDEDAPWWAEVNSTVPTQAFRDLHRAQQGFFRGQGFPRYKRKGKCRDSFRIYGPARFVGTQFVRLYRLGVLRLKESPQSLAQKVEAGTATVGMATVSRIADRWFVTFNVQVERELPPSRSGPATGIDLGIANFATLSDGTVIPHPTPYKAGLRKLRRLNQAAARTQKGSNRRKKAVLRLQKHHARVANIRNDAIHKATTHLAKTKPVLVLEDLHVRGMVRNRHLARAISDAGWSEFRRQLTYKSEWYGATLIIAPRFMPSSKTCSGCGAKKAQLSLADRAYRCDECGLVLDRDHNAALNLAAVSATEAQNARGDLVRPASSGGDGR